MIVLPHGCLSHVWQTASLETNLFFDKTNAYHTYAVRKHYVKVSYNEEEA